MEEILIGAMLSGQRNIKIGNVEFENMPVIKRDTQRNREIEARKHAKELIRILEED